MRTGTEALIGLSGVAESDLAPLGRVWVEGESWRAEVEGEPVRQGEHVIVTGVSGVTLRVAHEPS